MINELKEEDIVLRETTGLVGSYEKWIVAEWNKDFLLLRTVNRKIQQTAMITKNYCYEFRYSRKEK